MLSVLRSNENKNYIPTVEQYQNSNAWGLYSSVDIYNCDPEYIRDEEIIKLYIIQLCDLLEIKRLGETQIVFSDNGGSPQGCTVVQFIEGSVITGRFSHLENSIYIDILCSKYYNPEVVAHLTVSFFKGSHYILNIAVRK